MLPVNEIFETIQGEAHWTGTPAVFLRLQGCDVGCPWCDTKHTWAVDPAREVAIDAMLAKEGDAPTYARLDPGALVELIRGRFTARHIVITGGEPCVHDLSDFTLRLASHGLHVQVETSGTQPVRVDPRTWVTVSPKIGMPGGFAVRRDALERANEIKHPVGKPADVERLAQLLAEHGVRPPLVWLQPLSQSEKATEICMVAARDLDWRVSIQTHKFIGVR